jgi:REP element-mobilizing transposase RayT
MAVGRSRKRHVQQELFRHGGKRRGAGRKPKGERASEGHRTRPVIKPEHGMHVVLRVVAEVGNLRRPAMYRAIHDASVCAAVRQRMRIVHISVQRTHIHMIVEAEDKVMLGRGMQGFQISAARRINTALGDGVRRRGAVFVDRYHLVVLTSPTQAKHALSYVLNNWRKHEEDRDARRGALIDRFSSGCSFPDWRELEHTWKMWKIPADYDPLVVYRPQSWLLTKGWKLAGTISAFDVPSKHG